MLDGQVTLPIVLDADPDVLTYALPAGAKLFDAADLIVQIEDENGILVHDAQLATHYTVDLSKNFDASVTFLSNAELIAGRKIVLDRLTAQTQPRNFRNMDRLPGESIERQADRQVAMAQDLWARVGRAIMTRRGESLPTLPPLADIAGKLFYPRADMSGYETIDPGKFSAVMSSGALEPGGSIDRVGASLSAIEDLADDDMQVAILALSFVSAYLPEISQALQAGVIDPEAIQTYISGTYTRGEIDALLAKAFKGFHADFAANRVHNTSGAEAHLQAVLDNWSFARGSAASIVKEFGGLSTVATGVMALTRDPGTGERAGVTIGSAATNQLVDADLLTSGVWTKSNIQIDTVGGAAPDGSNAWRLTDLSGTAVALIRQNMTSTGIATDGHANFSFFAKAAVGAGVINARLTFYGASTFVSHCTIDLNDGSLSGDDVNGTSDVTPYANGWYRVSLSAQNNGAGNTNVQAMIYPSYPSTAAANDSILVSDLTVHLGDRDLGIVDGRAADTLSRPLTGLDLNFINGGFGVTYGKAPGIDNIAVIAQMDDGTAGNLVTIYLDDVVDRLLAIVKVDGVTVASIAGGSDVRGGGTAFLRWTGGTLELYFNGVLAGDASVEFPQNLTHLRAGSAANGTLQPHAAIRDIWVLPYAPSASEIVTLSGNYVDAKASGDRLSLIDRMGVEASAALRSRSRIGLAAFTEDYSAIFGLGQSFAFSGSQALPPLTTTSVTDVFSFGESVRPANVGATFDPVSQAALLPMVATADNAGTVFDQAYLDENAGAYSTSINGEAPIVAFSQHLKQAFSDLKHEVSAGPKVVGGICAKGETALADIANTSGNTYLRMVDFAGDVAGIASGLSASSGVTFVIAHHGEADRDADPGASYSAAWAQYMDDFHADVTQGVFSQTRNALWLCTVASKANWSTAHNRVPNAMIELESERDDVILVAPTYACQNADDNEHPSANGSRQLGYFAAKAADRYLRGVNHFCPRIVHAEYGLDEIYLSIAAMRYPLQAQEVWAQNSFDRAAVSDLGYTVYSDGVEMPILSVDIVNGYQSLVRIRTQGLLSSTSVEVSYAGANNAGRGMICDSDDYQSYHTYIGENQNQKAGESIPELNGQLYPSQNYALPQRVVCSRTV